jgi:hypothetical protein
VLDVPKDVVEQAPQIDRQAFSDLQMYDQKSEEINRYWQEHAAG